MIALLASMALGGMAVAEPAPLCPRAAAEGWTASDGAAYMRWELLESFRMGIEQVEAMERLFSAFAAAGLTVIVPLVPPRPVGDPGQILVDGRPYKREQVLREYQALLRWMSSHQVLPVDLTADALAGFGGDPPFFSHFDDHWTSAGSRVAARRVAEVARGQPAHSGGTRVEWTSQLVETVAGQSALLRRCGEGFGETTRYLYDTRRKQEVGLLDELPPPSAVAVGTSQSGPNSNFVGFLREYLERDVAAYAVPGGGALSGLARWLFTETDPDTRPRLLIWELVMVHLFSVPADAPPIRESEFFRELIPAVAGDCAKRALAQGTSAEGLVLRVPPRIEARGDGYYLVFTGPLPVDFEVMLRHADGEDRHHFQAFDRVGAVPSRFLALDPDRAGALSMVRAKGTFPDGVTTRLCKR